MHAATDAAIGLVDTSVAVALVVADHEDHAATIEALDGHVLGFASTTPWSLRSPWSTRYG